MSRKQLQHAADILCQMFCGWRLTSFKPKLAELGSGTLEIDALSGRCWFEGNLLSHAAIAEELQAWLHADLANHRIPLEVVTSARLTAKLSLSEIRWSQRENKTQIFLSSGSSLRPEKLYRCRIECRGEIVTAEATYEARHQDVEEWPFGWPAAT